MDGNLIRVIALVLFLVMFAPSIIELWATSKLDRMDNGFPDLTIEEDLPADFHTQAKESIFKERLGGLA